MQTDPRHPYLNELGLTLWRQRAECGAAVAGIPEAIPKTVPKSVPETVPETGPQEISQVREPTPELHELTAVNEQPAPVAPAELEQPSEQQDAAPNNAYAAMNWQELEASLADLDHRGATRPVFGVGAKDAPLLIVGEAPGAEEDKKGEPFVGRAGKLLDRMLFAIGHDRQQNTYVVNICKFRPPDNRDPNAEEVAADRPILERQIALLQPRLIVAVGRVAAQTLLSSTENLGKMRERLHEYPGMNIPVLVTYHPAYLLRSPQQKAKSWEDLKQIATLLSQSKAQTKAPE